MKKLALGIILLSIFLASCGRSVTPQQAANNHYKACRPIR